MTTLTRLSPTIQAEIDRWLACFPAEEKRSAVIPALHAVQAEHQGHLTPELMDAVAAYLELPPIAVYEVATFYSMYNHQPVGRHVIEICDNISCLLTGAKDIVTHCQKRLGIQVGATTVDGKVTLRTVECLGACVAGPVCQIGQHYHEHLTPEKMDAILQELE